MIVVEGCDGTGKTTLANALSADLNLRIGERGTKNRDDLYKVTREDSYRALAHAVEGYHPPYLWDRLGPISDPVYARVMGRKCAFTDAEIQWYHRMLKAIAPPIIICDIPLELAKENAERDKQMDGVLENFPYIHGMYQGVAKLMERIVIQFDYTKDQYHDIVDLVDKYLERRKPREWH